MLLSKKEKLRFQGLLIKGRTETKDDNNTFNKSHKTSLWPWKSNYSVNFKLIFIPSISDPHVFNVLVEFNNRQAKWSVYCVKWKWFGYLISIISFVFELIDSLRIVGQDCWLVGWYILSTWFHFPRTSSNSDGKLNDDCKNIRNHFTVHGLRNQIRLIKNEWSGAANSFVSW